MARRGTATQCRQGSHITAVHKYTVNHKKRDILFLTITLANLKRFL